MKICAIILFILLCGGIIGCENETVPVTYCIERKNRYTQKIFLCKNCAHKLVFC